MGAEPVVDVPSDLVMLANHGQQTEARASVAQETDQDQSVWGGDHIPLNRDSEGLRVSGGKWSSLPLNELWDARASPTIASRGFIDNVRYAEFLSCKV